MKRQSTTRVITGIIFWKKTHANINNKEKIPFEPEGCGVSKADTLLINMAIAKVCAAGINAPKP